jgi:hypothetical protein
MTTLNQARTAIYTRWLDQWKVGLNPRTPYCFDDETFDPPAGDDGRGATWARLSVRHIAGGQQTLGRPGNRKFTRSALVRVEVYTVPGAGLSEADGHIQAAKDMYEGTSLAGALLYDAQTAEVGLVDEGRWFLSTMQASFDYEELK